LDLESAAILKKFSTIIGLPTNNILKDQRHFLSLNNLENSKICLIIDLNLRLQLPILNLNLRQLFLKKGLMFYTLGYSSDFNFYTKHLSINQKLLTDLIEGSH
jgi:hypothetical protein